ncbi:MAG: LytTR family DNA-binding domain-containing protein [Vicingaceae bacterium]
MNLIDFWYNILEQLLRRQIRRHELTISREKIVFYPGDIIRIEADGSYCNIVTVEKNYLISKNLAQVERLIHGWGIVRVNRSTIINVAHIKGLSKVKRLIIMSDGAEVVIPRKNKKKVTQFLSYQYRVDASQPMI